MMKHELHNPGRETPRHWRSLAELSNAEEWQAASHREFPTGASEWEDDVSRRHFLKIMGASIALAGFSGCTKQPVEKIVPYVEQPPEMTPGKPLYFASASTLNGYASGIVVTSREGRPIKIEGNPNHPGSRGATSIFTQATILDLYDRDRAQTILHGGDPASWEDFVSAMNDEMRMQKTKQGAGLRILSGNVTSPTLQAQIKALLTVFPSAKWHWWEPLNRDNILEGARLAFGRALETQYRVGNANVILALDSDFLSTHPASLSHAREFAAGRRVSGTAETSFNRLYAAEPSLTLTGAMADHRFAVAASEIAGIAAAVAAQLGLKAGNTGNAPDWIGAVVDDLKENAGKGLVIVGERQPPEVHALAHAINHALGNDGKTVVYTESAAGEGALASLKELAVDLKSGVVDFLLILGGDPAFNAPADFDFGAAMQKAKVCARLGVDENDTSRYCHWHIPAAHELESWGDALSFDGTTSVIQPLIEPLYGGKTALEVVDVLLRQPSRGSYDIVRDFWNSQRLPDFEKTWRKALSDGLMPMAKPPETSAVPTENIAISPPSEAGGLEVMFSADPAIWDGRFANNAWLQELPRPFSKLTWDNAALISPALAGREGLETGDVVELRVGNRTLKAPVWVAPGQAENTVTLHLGYGRRNVGRVGAGVGFNAYALRTSDAPWIVRGPELKKTGEKYRFAGTQTHFNIEGRDIIREGTAAEFNANTHFIDTLGEPLPGRDDTLYHPNEFKYTGYKWGMSIDLNTCIGCNACTIACQAENNIPVVGKDMVARGRVMHWIRVDTYFAGESANPAATHQPVPCMHCENAPCELVCPVGATVTDSEGLNVQVYNRCIGTRYCSNNCPYKVRRFNFFEYNAGMTPVEKMAKNPEVTVRSRGVMEKCTYCVQRINAARAASELEDRKIRDGEVVPACQAACPVEAIIFGDLNDTGSRVSKRKALPLDYSMLGELNARPRTTYLGKLRNPNLKVRSA